AEVEVGDVPVAVDVAEETVERQAAAVLHRGAAGGCDLGRVDAERIDAVDQAAGRCAAAGGLGERAAGGDRADPGLPAVGGGRGGGGGGGVGGRRSVVRPAAAGVEAHQRHRPGRQGDRAVEGEREALDLRALGGAVVDGDGIERGRRVHGADRVGRG